MAFLSSAAMLAALRNQFRRQNYVTATLSRSYTDTTEGPQQLSYAHGGPIGGKTFIQTTLVREVDRMVDLHGDREAIVDCAQGIRKTFVEHKKEIDRLATGLLALNFKRGDRIVLWCPNRYEWVAAQLAAAKAGLVLTTLNPAYQAAEVAYCLKKVGASGLIMMDNFKTQDYYKLLTTGAPEVMDAKPGQIKSSKLPDLKTLIMITEKDFPGAYKFKDILTAGGSTEKKQMDALSNEIDMDDALTIQFTSGTTGKPKAVVMSHHNVVTGCRLQSERIGYCDKDHRMCVVAPLFHSIASGTPVNNVIYGSCTILPAPSFNAGTTLEVIQAERCTTIAATPTMYLDMLNHPNFNKTDLTSLRNGAIGGSTCQPEIMKAVMTKMHCKGLVVGYGATEVAGAITIHKHDESFETKIASDGQIYEYMEIKIVNERGVMVPMGMPGEICVRGYKVMKGYWDDEETTKSVLKNQWYHTGDIGYLMAGGRVKVLDRIKDMIIRGGENIAPREIEEYLSRHPKISEVHVIGVPDKRMGEEVCAWIRLKNNNKTLTEDEVKQFCQGQISHYKIPRYVKFVDNFPKSAIGKVQKTEMRKEMMKLMSAHEELTI